MRRASYKDLVALPEGVTGELIDGELFASPRPAARHTVVASTLTSELGGAFQSGRFGPGGWWILVEPELHFGEDVLVPDLAGWRRERMPHILDEPAFTIVPDWVCEILSPSTARVDLVRKLPRYASVGVAHCWLFDPALKTMQVLRNVDGRWLVASGFTSEDKVRAEPFEALELELSRVFPRS